MASPFLLRAVIDDALPQQNLHPARLAGGRHGRRRRRDLRAGRRPDLDLDDGRPAGHAPAAHRRLRAPAAPVDRLLHPHPHRRGAVADHQRHRRHAVRRHLDRHLGRLEPHHRRRDARRDARAELAAHAGVPARAAAVDLADPPGRPHAPGGHRRPAARAGRPQRHRRRGPLDRRRAAVAHHRHRPRAGRPVHRVVVAGWSTSSCARSSPAAGGWPPRPSSSPRSPRSSTSARACLPGRG